MSKKSFPALVLVAVAVVWGTTFFVVKNTVSAVDAYLLVALRNAMAALPLLVLVLVRRPQALRHGQVWRHGAVLGGLLAVMYTSQTIGLQFTSAGHSAFITGIAVVLVPVVMFVFFGYRFRVQHVVAILTAALGLFLLTYDTQTRINLGDLVTLVTAITAAMHIVLVGRMARQNYLLALVALQFFFASVFNFAAHVALAKVPWVVPAGAWPALVYLGLVGSLFCYGASSWAQKYVEPVAAGLIFSLEPVFAALFSYIFIHEVLHLPELMGAALILLGIALYELPTARIVQRFARFQKKKAED